MVGYPKRGINIKTLVYSVSVVALAHYPNQYYIYIKYPQQTTYYSGSIYLRRGNDDEA